MTDIIAPTNIIARRATTISSEAMDAWDLGVITSTTFREVSEGCLYATQALRAGDPEEATRLLDEASALLNYLA